MPNNLRDPRYRPPKVGASEPTEVGTGGSSHGPAVGVKHHARRLEALEGMATSRLGEKEIESSKITDGRYLEDYSDRDTAKRWKDI